MTSHSENTHLLPSRVSQHMDHSEMTSPTEFKNKIDTSGEDSGHQTASQDSVDFDPASIRVRGDSNVQIDAEGEVFTISRAGSVHLALSSELGRSTPWQYASAYSIGSISNAPYMEEYAQFTGLDETALIQAVVFIEDAYKYRSINHKVDESCLRLYRHYHSTSVHVFRWIVIFVLHVLAFFESPSSLTLTSDMRFRGDRIESPCWLMEMIELICLLLLLVDNIIRGYLMGKYYFMRHKWDVGAVILLLISIVDWAVSAAFGCSEVVRIRRMLRPFFIVQNSSLMKKIVNCLRRTMPEVLSVLVMLGMHLYIFTLFGMLLFPVPQDSDRKITKNFTKRDTGFDGYPLSNITESPLNPTNAEGDQYFSSLLDSFMSLLVLLTTANNPDVTMPAYSRNRFFFIFFILFLIVGLYCFWNMLTAVIYNQFRGYFLSSMQGSLTRRRLGVRAAFEVLRRKRGLLTYATDAASALCDGVGGYVIKSVVDKAMLPRPIKEAIMEKTEDNLEMMHSAKDFQHVFLALDVEAKPPVEVGVRWFEHPVARRIQNVIIHDFFSYFGLFVAFCNVVIISVDLATKYAESFDDTSSALRMANFAFANYYVVEQLLKLWASGLRRYFHYKTNIFDAATTLALLVCEMYSTIKFGLPFFYSRHSVSSISTLWNILRIINILIMIRLLKIIPHLKSMQIISSVLLDLVSNMKAFAGVLIVIYYVFAILGMELFHDVIKFNNITDSNRTFECGSYRQLQYWSNNFDDFAASLVVLWDVMVVNNWMVFLEAYRTATSAWSYLYFVAWWMISVIIVLNLFTALIMENFIMKWDRSQQMRQTPEETFSQPISLNTVHDMFRGLLKEPADNELLVELCVHRHLNLDR